MSEQTTAEIPELATSKPVTIYALVSWRWTTPWGENQTPRRYIASSYVIQRRDDGTPEILNDEEGEYTYGECDFSGLSGLVTFDGAIYTKTPAWDKADEDTRLEWSGNEGVDFYEFDEVYSGKWRPMTADEARALGLLV